MKRNINEQTFITAYDEYADAIFRYCSFNVNDRERAREIMQETFTRTWDYLRGGKEIRLIKPFLYRVAHNLCADERARNAPYSLDALREDGGFDPPDPDAKSDAFAEKNILFGHVETLAPLYREVLSLRFGSGLSIEEISTILGESKNTISVRIHRALEELRKKIHEV